MNIKEYSSIPPLPRGDKNCNPNDIGFIWLVLEDLKIHDNDVFSQGFWAIFSNRFGNWRMGIPNKFLRLPFKILYQIMRKIVQWLCGIQLDYTVKVGRRVKLEHFGGMILVPREIGNDVTIRQNTTFGIANVHQLNAKPIIEDRVDIGAGVCILGHVRIGHDSIIGANAVVIRDVPPYSVVVGVPGRVIKTLSPEQSLEQECGNI